MTDEKLVCKHGKTKPHTAVITGLRTLALGECPGPVIATEPQEDTVSADGVLAQAEYRLKLLFEEYGVAINSPFFEAVYHRIELTVGKVMRNAPTEPATPASKAAGGSHKT